MPTRPGKPAALVVAHIAGMIDLVALPIWVGTLMQHFHFDAQRAGMLATLYLLFAVIVSALFARHFDRIRGHVAAPVGFAIAAIGFFALSQTGSFTAMCFGHALAGAGTGCGLSFAHGAIGRTANPHRLFAFSHLALALFAVVFLGGAPQIIAQAGGAALFMLFSALAAAACIATAWGFPRAVVPRHPLSPTKLRTALNTRAGSREPLAAGCWSAIFGIVFMAVNQALVFSFVERIGVARGFGVPKINAVLIAVGLVNLLPPLLAALLQKRLDARTVAIAGPIAQAVLALTVSRATSFAPYAVATSLWVFAMIFTHTFLFGLLARIDTSGRAVASTPAMLMAGSAVGPLLGGILIVHAGFEAIGIAATVISAISVLFLIRLRSMAVVSTSLDAAHAP
jgi:predicted MFS family arabinose efflux permease